MDEKELSVAELNALIDVLDEEIAALRKKKRELNVFRKAQIIKESAIAKLQALKPEELEAMGIKGAFDQHINLKEVAEAKIGPGKKKA